MVIGLFSKISLTLTSIVKDVKWILFPRETIKNLKKYWRINFRNLMRTQHANWICIFFYTLKFFKINTVNFVSSSFRQLGEKDNKKDWGKNPRNSWTVMILTIIYLANSLPIHFDKELYSVDLAGPESRLTNP